MILNIILFKNKKINAFTQPQFTDIEPEKAALQLSRSLVMNDKKEIDDSYKNLDMYVVGTFDDETGVIVQTGVKKLLDCGEVISSRNRKDGKDDIESVPASR